ncbi:GNAT family N-acetyltransferase [Streptomyces sp. NPDC059639]|uniref:GNAT family N-acetyltransferase n=1 Tax=Streptomyces sp. NPDC059639 TaxID=3346891 RepID=UPI0036C31FBF
MKSTVTEFLRPAGPADVDALMRLRTEAEGWLKDKGTDQWNDAETGARAISKWQETIDDGRTWVCVDVASGGVIGTVSRGPADRDFWTDADKPESGLYLYKLIVAREASGRHLGARMVDWTSRVAALEGRDWVRIDTWRTNAGLHGYYERLGFKHLRTESPAHRRSGWIAQRSAGERSFPDDLLRVLGDISQ